MTFDRYKTKINSAIVNEIELWGDHPELSKIYNKLKAVTGSGFFNHMSEAMIARQLLKKNVPLQVEVPTSNGKSADFKIEKDGTTLFLHIKRLNLDGETTSEQKRLLRLSDLKKINRPIILSVLLLQVINEEQTRKLYNLARKQINSGYIGSFDFIDNRQHIAECEIKEFPNLKRVQLIITGSANFVEDKERIYKLLSKAYKQFHPSFENIILLTSDWGEDFLDFKEALIGDADLVVPDSSILHKVTDRKAYWGDNKHCFSRIAGWFDFDLKQDTIAFTFFFRKYVQNADEILELFKQ